VPSDFHHARAVVLNTSHATENMLRRITKDA